MIFGSAIEMSSAGRPSIDRAAGRADAGREADEVIAVAVDDRSGAAEPDRPGRGGRDPGAGTQREREGEDERKAVRRPRVHWAVSMKRTSRWFERGVGTPDSVSR